MSRLRNIFSSLKKSLFPSGRQATHVGTDQHGNKYFEKLADVTNNLRGSRYIEEPQDRYRDPFDPPIIPVEWESWLRMKRNDPPTEEEIQRNYARMMQTRMRAQELEKGFATKKIESNDSVAVPTENLTQESFKSEFPSYPEFENKPGQKKR